MPHTSSSGSVQMFLGSVQLDQGTASIQTGSFAFALAGDLCDSVKLSRVSSGARMFG